MLSIVIPVYNMEKYLKKCLDSIIRQTYSKIEIICVNNGSKDSSLDILREYEKKDKRIIVINQPNKGPSSARNAGILAATGQYITFIDADDYIEPETYQVCMPLFSSGVDAVCFGAKVIAEEKGGKQKGDDAYYSVHHKNVVIPDCHILMQENVACWNKIFNIDIIRKNNILFPENLLYEDAEFYWKYMVNARKIFFLEQKFYNYIRHEGSIMHDTFSGTEKAIDHLYIVFNLFDYFKSSEKYSHYLQEAWPALFERYFWLAYQHTIKQKRKDILSAAENFISDNRLAEQYPDNVFISRINQKKAYYYKNIDEYSFAQKLFSIKKMKQEKYIHILGLKIRIKKSIYKNIWNFFFKPVECRFAVKLHRPDKVSR